MTSPEGEDQTFLYRHKSSHVIRCSSDTFHMLPCEEEQTFISGKRQWVGRSWWSALLLHGGKQAANYLLSVGCWSHNRRQSPVARQGAGLETRCALKGSYSAWRVLSLLRQKKFCRRDVCVSHIFINRDIWRWEIAPKALRKWRFTVLSRKGKRDARLSPYLAGKILFLWSFDE